MWRTTFIAVSGSLGKTTTKELLAGILSTRYPTFATLRNQNGFILVILNLLRVRPWHRYAVIEVGIGGPGEMKRIAKLVEPDLAIILNIRRTHSMSFRNPADRVTEKAILLDSVKSGGKIILNADDPQVYQMSEGRRPTILFFGTNQSCHMRAEDISAVWPNRLGFKACLQDQSVEIRTQLVGEHWLSASLASLLVAVSLGFELEDAGEALRHVSPFTGRMQPVELPGGFTVIRDDYNASIDAVGVSLQFLRQAQASRKILVLRDFSDYEGNRKQRLKYLADLSRDAAELVVHIGELSEYGCRRLLEFGFRPDQVFAFPTLSQASDFLKQELRAGDLVLLKGRTTDHAARIFWALQGDVGCWVEYCPKRFLCDFCWELGNSQLSHRQIQ